jgi:putative transposase
MPSTYLSLNFHVVFGTKGRHPYMSANAARVHEYMAGTLRGLGATPLQVGGVADHVHLLFSTRANHVLADVVRETKKASTKWMRSEIGVQDFAWQEGYGAFTVSAERLAGVTRYIQEQEEHHRAKSFEKEYVELLRLAGSDFDPRDW